MLVSTHHGTQLSHSAKYKYILLSHVFITFSVVFFFFLSYSFCLPKPYYTMYTVHPLYVVCFSCPSQAHVDTWLSCSGVCIVCTCIYYTRNEVDFSPLVIIHVVVLLLCISLYRHGLYTEIVVQDGLFRYKNTNSCSPAFRCLDHRRRRPSPTRAKCWHRQARTGRTLQ